MPHEFAILQAARLKGRLSPQLGADSCGVDVATIEAAFDSLRTAGLLKGEPSVRLTPDGRARLTELLESERTTIDQQELTFLYDEFDEYNAELKQIVSDWQLRDGSPNDHSDAAYDASVLDRLIDLDTRFQPLVSRISAVAPRLSTYPRRFTHAIEQIRDGDLSYVARPISDSYHTVWFEFHEELIGLLGRTREAEAAAGRAV